MKTLRARTSVHIKHGPDALEGMSDENLMKQYQQGEMKAFEILVERYREKLTKFIHLYVKDWHRCDDLVQDAFLKIHWYKDKFRLDEKSVFYTWIYAIAKNLAFSEYHWRQRHKIEMSIHQKDNKNEEFEIDIMDQEALPGENMDTEEYVKKVHSVIPTIPTEHQEVLIMRDFQQLTYEEIAEITGLPMGTVKSRINRGRNAVQMLLPDVVKERKNVRRRKAAEKNSC